MTFKQIAENLRTTGRKFKWGRMLLVRWGGEEPAYCALGIKATEYGVPMVVLAYVQTKDRIARYSDFGLVPVYTANDQADDYEGVLHALESLEGEESAPNVEGWIEYLKTQEPAARKWAHENGYKSLLA